MNSLMCNNRTFFSQEIILHSVRKNLQNVFPAFHPLVCQVVQAAAGRLPVFLDGGVRRGTDVFKALALGASGVFVSNPNPNSTFNMGSHGVRVRRSKPRSSGTPLIVRRLHRLEDP